MLWFHLFMLPILGICGGGVTVERYQPEQIHLAYGNDFSEMVVTWSTWQDPGEPVVEYGVQQLDMRATGHTSKFVDGGDEKRTQYIHRVSLKGLKPGVTYFYHCGSKQGWSDLFYFTAMKSGSNWSPQLAVYGDLGNSNAQSLTRLQKETLQGMYDAILHVGDFAYDLHSDNGRVGDEFMRQIEPVAAYIPYMTCVGNHEAEYNFSNYKSRFSMPGTENNLMYSFNMGPVHFVAISTEFYYFTNYGIKQIVKQYNWLLSDLHEANKTENRVKRPWIILFGHRPMYCSNSDHDDCTNYETVTRVGLPFVHWFGLEPLLNIYGVDLVIWAHEHSYERLWPLYDRKVHNGSYSEPYRNPRAPVHIITGSAGCSEIHDDFKKEKPSWSAFRSVDYGYSRLQVFNSTHLYMEQVSDDQEGQVIDRMCLIREKHLPYWL